MLHACLNAYLLVSLLFYGIFFTLAVWKQERGAAIFWSVFLAMPLSLLIFGA